jgi:hypothetical protein
MNRSAKISRQARQATGWACVNLMVAVTVGVWATRVWMSEPPLGVGAFVCALVVLRIAALRLREAWRLASLSAVESWHESGGGRVRR